MSKNQPHLPTRCDEKLWPRVLRKKDTADATPVVFFFIFLKRDHWDERNQPQATIGERYVSLLHRCVAEGSMRDTRRSWFFVADRTTARPILPQQIIAKCAGVPARGAPGGDEQGTWNIKQTIRRIPTRQ